MQLYVKKKRILVQFDELGILTIVTTDFGDKLPPLTTIKRDSYY